MGIRADVETLAAKQAITEVLHTYCRAMDRMDHDLALSCWHQGGTDEHSSLYSGSAQGWIEWVERFHAPMTVTRHVLSNILIEVAGGDAWAESYWTLALRIPREPENDADFLGGGRYLDYFRCVDGLWAIQHRRTTNDWDRVEPVGATILNPGGRPLIDIDISAPAFVGSRDRSDPSYAFLGAHETKFSAL